jgi:hypothetical protein
MTALSRSWSLALVTLFACTGPPVQPHPHPIDDPGDATSTEEACRRELRISGPTLTCPTQPDLANMPTSQLARLLDEAQLIGDRCREVAILSRARPIPAVLGRLAAVQLALGAIDDALANATRCARSAGDAPTRQRCEDLVARIEAARARVTVSGGLGGGLRWFLDGKPHDGAERQVVLRSGAHDIAVFVPNTLCCQRHLDLADGDDVEVDVALSRTTRPSCFVMKALAP